MDTWQFVFGLLTLLTVVVSAALRVQKVIRDEMRVEFATMKTELDARSREVTEGVEIKLSRQNAQYAETFAAMRQQMNENQLWVRDHCVQTGPFSEILGGLRSDILRNRQEASDRFEKIDGKIDQLLSRQAAMRGR